MSFLEDRATQKGVTFDDVLLLPRYSTILPHEADISTRLTSTIGLNIPLMSAAMDTVTEEEMAIALAHEGGIGVLHRNMSIERQQQQVCRVKRAESVMIRQPLTIEVDALVLDVFEMMAKFKIGGIPVIDQQGKLAGLVTNRDLRFELNMHRPIRELMTPVERLVTVRKGIDLQQAEEILQRHRVEKLPVLDDNDFLYGMITYKDIAKAQSRPLASKDSHGRLRVAAAIGVRGDAFERAEALLAADVDVLVIDTAHAHSAGVIALLQKIRRSYPAAQLVAGNCATGAAAKDLIAAGADAIKVGIGPGSICTTRIVAGIGVPQLSAIYEVAKVCSPAGVVVIADGGVRYSGDLVKALAAGADVVMIGSLFAGVNEAPGETIIYNGRKYKSYQGMGSIEAMQRGSGERYYQEGVGESSKLVPEGIAARVPYVGELCEVVYQLLGGIRAGMGYCGCADIGQLHQSEFIRVSAASVIENHPHNVSITSEAPNYSR